ncbi:MAG: ammonia-forming cytochrome c nitrite reductase subunit c552 [Clostridiaceae bacterium]|nr:ammonia-forming cytochrome c nitrite reductase subunit c552 [Clostridiaceae bacterium]
MKKYISFFMMIVLIFTIVFTSTGCRPEDVPPAEDPEPGEPIVEGPQVPWGEVPAIEDMIIDSAAWEEEYPLIYQSFLLTARMGDNTVEDSTLGGLHPTDYLEKYPNIKILYEGFGFAKEYYAARGHYYSMEDVINTARPKPGANCLACKTGDYERLFVEHGEDLFLMDFYKTAQEVDHPISCYNCHRNEPEGEIQVTGPHLAVGLTHLEEEPPAGTLACAQCHVEYYFDTETGAVTLPWHNGTGIDEIESYFDEINFADWTHPRTGTPLIKVQHPEFEMYTGSVHDRLGLSCADCHMPTMTEDGEEYVSHWAKSPLKTAEESCGECHRDSEAIITQTEDIQREIDAMQVEVSDLIVQLIEEFADALERRVIDDDEVIDRVRSLHRASQYRWDFVMVENSTGFHNASKARQALERAKEQAEEALDILAEYQ